MTEESIELILREKIQRFIRVFGLLRNQTPCGKPISVSAAHALMSLKTAGREGPLSQGDIQKTLALDKSNVTRLCRALEEDGYILQRQSEDDRRVHQVSLTKKGYRLADSLLKASRGRFSEILEQISKDELLQIFHSLDVLSNAIHEANMREERKKV
ncbi:MAG: MarR family transcriptional regulator [Nitrospirae bacterium]|nr:MarR family transcriptional regulator [Nitrospirota bacterium]MBI3351644.1 MarR family transcriptional regulator [Nitrospirota bacterium]